MNPDELVGKIEALPRSLIEAVTALEGDFVLRDVLGEPLVKAVIAIRRVGIIKWIFPYDVLLETLHHVFGEFYLVSVEL